MADSNRGFDGEAEARQHLSEAQLKAGTALAAADPFTERVQTGDRVLYRARFAGFDKEAAEIACKQLGAVNSNAWPSRDSSYERDWAAPASAL